MQSFMLSITVIFCSVLEDWVTRHVGEGDLGSLGDCNSRTRTAEDYITADSNHQKLRFKLDSRFSCAGDELLRRPTYSCKP